MKYKFMKPSLQEEGIASSLEEAEKELGAEDFIQEISPDGSIYFYYPTEKERDEDPEGVYCNYIIEEITEVK